MKEYIVATGDQLKRLTQTGLDHFEECHGLGNRKIFCTQKYLRDRIREVFDNAKSSPYVSIQTKHPKRMVEGLQITEWNIFENEEAITCVSADIPYPMFFLSNIARFVI